MILVVEINNNIGTPVRNLQNMLRLISQNDSRINLIIADGIFGAQTKNAVISFQKLYNLSPTGEVDFETFEEIVRVYNIIKDEKKPFRKTGIISFEDFLIYPGDSSEHLNVIKAMVKNISLRFDNIDNVSEINEMHDDEFVNIIKQIQSLSNLSETGIIDKATFEIISYLYEALVGGFLV